MTNKRVRCTGCGKFISFKDLIDGNVLTDVTPLNEFGPEKIEHYHRGCV